VAAAAGYPNGNASGGSAGGAGGPMSPSSQHQMGSVVQPATSSDDVYLLELGFPPRIKTKKLKKLKSDPGQAKRKSREGWSHFPKSQEQETRHFEST